MADKEQANTDDQIRELRRAIDALDEELLRLLNERFALTRKIGRRKAETGSGIVDKARETAMIEALVEKNRGGMDADMVRRIFADIIAVGRQAQAARTISYLGPEATFTHAAAQGYFGAFDRYWPQASIKDVFDEVEKGSSDYGVVPVENSIEGAVNHTLDLFPESSLHICAEIYLAISHDLLSVSGRIDAIQRIYSHPQTFAQCRKWLQMNLPDAERIECGSNAQAAARALADTDSAARPGAGGYRFRGHCRQPGRPFLRFVRGGAPDPGFCPQHHPLSGHRPGQDPPHRRRQDIHHVCHGPYTGGALCGSGTAFAGRHQHAQTGVATGQV